MTDNAQINTQKVIAALKCIQKTIQCTLCKKLPTNAAAPKCGHPFCAKCIETLLHSKKAVCSICKTVIIKSNVRRLLYLDKLFDDFKKLTAAIEKDSSVHCASAICQDRSIDEPTMVRQYEKKRQSTEKQPSASKDNTSVLPSQTLMQGPRNPNGTRLEMRKPAGCDSIFSEETMKIHRRNLNEKNSEAVGSKPTTSRASNSTLNMFTTTAEKLATKELQMEPTEKVGLWLSTEKFETNSETADDFPEITKQNMIANSMEIDENLDSPAQTRRHSSSMSSKSRSNSPLLSNKSRALNYASNKQQNDDDVTKTSRKYKSFSLALKNKSKNSKPKAVTPAEEMFDELISNKSGSKKSAAVLASSKDSWSQLAQFGKETRSKVRKRRRLNISIGKPDTARQTLESKEDSREEQSFEPADQPTAQDSGRKSVTSSAEKNVEQSSSGKQKQVRIVSSRMLKKNEMIVLPTLNRREVNEIIGIGLTESDLDHSKNSIISPDKSTKAKLPPRKSNENSQDTGNESAPPDDLPKKTTPANVADNIRPQSKQSFQLSNSHPDSRLSMESPTQPTPPEKFKLSLNRQFPMPSVTPSKISPNPDKVEQEKIVFLKDSPVRSCNNFERNKLSLKKSLPTASEKKIFSIKKLGRLSKSRNRFKFLKLGAIKSRLIANKLENTSVPPILTCDTQTQTNITVRNAACSPIIKLRDLQTQTSSELTNVVKATSNRHREIIGNESLVNKQLRRSHGSWVASNDVGKIDSSVNSTARTTDSLKSKEQLDTINKVNMLSPERDSQLQYLEINSPAVEHTAEGTDEEFGAKRRSDSPNFVGCVLQQNHDDYMKELDRYAEKLIMTDSEGQDMANEDHDRNKRDSNCGANANSPSKNKSVNIASSSKMYGQINARGSQNLTSSEIPASCASLKRKILSRDSLNSQKKEKNSQTEASKSKNASSNVSKMEGILLRRTSSENGTQLLQDSESLVANSKHKVVRKLQYSQESSSSPNTEPEKAGPSSNREKQGKPADGSSDKKTFQRIRSIASSDSDSELMEISLSTKPSGSTASQNTLRPRVSQATKKSLLPDEEMSVEFSSNKDSPEPKRKRTLSSNSLDNVDLHAIASNWCADLDKSSEEIAAENTKVLEGGSRHAVKKPKFEKRRSFASNSNDDFPPFDANVAYCRSEPINTKVTSNLDKAKNHSSVNRIEKGENSRPPSVAKSILEKNKESCSSSVRNESTNPFNYEKAKNFSIVRNSPPCITPSANVELGDTLNGLITPEKNLIPVRSRTSQLSHNSNKENEMGGSQAKSWVEKRAAISGNVGKKIASSEDSSQSVKPVNQLISNNASISQRQKSADNTMLFDSCSDQDFLNITQEQILLQEVEDNLLGRNSKGVNGTNSQMKTEKMKDDVEVTLRAETPPGNKAAGHTRKGNAITEPDSDDSMTITEDIVESTPQKNFPPKKDLNNYGDCSQRSIISRKSFMSVDITPIAKRFTNQLQEATEISPLVERSASRMSIQQRGSSLTGSIHPSCHSTPKSSASIKVSRLNPPLQFDESEDKKNRRLCFISSCLTPKDVEKVKVFARLHGAEFTATYKREVTHVIVAANNDNSASRTLKYLLGIAHKKWIVSFQWVTDSMRQGRILQEDKYEVVDSETFDPGAKRSRLSSRGLFEDFAFICTDPIAEITASQMQDLIISTGGSVAQSLEKLASSTRKYKIYLYNSSVTDKEKLDNLRQRGQFLPVIFEWVFTCISGYELTSICPSIEPEDRELALDLGLPAELLVEVDESDSGNEESTSEVGQ